MSSHTQYALINLKAYGDMVIAAEALNMLYEEDAQKIALWIGSHHSELYHALQISYKVKFIETNKTDVPAIYDIREKGPFNAILSLVDIHNQIQHCSNDADIYLFDRLSWREKLLSYGHPSFAINTASGNIYLDYKQTFFKLFGRVKSKKVNVGSSKTILITPHGRKPFKNIPSDLIDKMSNICIKHGFDPMVYSLQNKQSLEYKIPRTIYANPSFNDLRETIQNSCALISADSLSAHLANFISKPVFVTSRYKQSAYWLPSNSLENSFWGIFDEPEIIMQNLERFLASLKSVPEK